MMYSTVRAKGLNCITFYFLSISQCRVLPNESLSTSWIHFPNLPSASQTRFQPPGFSIKVKKKKRKSKNFSHTKKCLLRNPKQIVRQIKLQIECKKHNEQYIGKLKRKKNSIGRLKIIFSWSYVKKSELKITKLFTT